MIFLWEGKTATASLRTIGLLYAAIILANHNYFLKIIYFFPPRHYMAINNSLQLLHQ